MNTYLSGRMCRANATQLDLAGPTSSTRRDAMLGLVPTSLEESGFRSPASTLGIAPVSVYSSQTGIDSACFSSPAHTSLPTLAPTDLPTRGHSNLHPELLRDASPSSVSNPPDILKSTPCQVSLPVASPCEFMRGYPSLYANLKHCISPIDVSPIDVSPIAISPIDISHIDILPISPCHTLVDVEQVEEGPVWRPW